MKCKICNFLFDETKIEALKAKCFFSKEDLTRYRCPKCSVIFGDMKIINLSQKELGFEYEKLYKTYKEADNTNLEVQLLKSIAPTPDKTKFYINWGCGGSWSRTLNVAANLGYNLVGYDIGAKTEDNFIINNLDTIEDESVDGIISNNYIEHMQDPIKEFSLMNSKMKKGSLMIHSTPCWRYYVEWTKFHLFFFEGPSLEILCEKTNFKLIKDYPVPEYPYKEYPNPDGNIKVFKKK